MNSNRKPRRSDAPARAERPAARSERHAGRSERPAGRSERPAGRGAIGTTSQTPYNRTAARLEQVRQVLGLVLQWEHPADAVLSHWFRAHPKLGGRDRHEVAEAVFDVLRHLRRYRHLAESGVGPSARRLAILGLNSLYAAHEMASGLDPQEQAWLEHVRTIKTENLPPALRHSLPDWLEAELQALPQPESLMAALNTPAPLDVRANPFKIDRDALLEALRNGPAARYSPRPTPYSPWGIRLDGRPPVNRWEAFERGELEVQDEGSQLLVALMAPKRGEMVIDYCAGAGGKTLLLGALMRSTGRLYAFDVSVARLARAKPRFARSGLSNIVPVAIAESNDVRVKRLRGKAQRVLVDAPCSGLGTLRRNPDLKWRQHPESLKSLLATQADILRQASRCVAPGGRLVYATCSLLPQENEQQVEAFLAANDEFSLVDAGKILKDRCENLTLEGPYLVLRPDVHGTDGFFAAVLERRKAPSAEDASADDTGNP